MKIAYLTPSVPLNLDESVPWHFLQEIVELGRRGQEVHVISGSRTQICIENVHFHHLMPARASVRSIFGCLFGRNKRLKGQGFRGRFRVARRCDALADLLGSINPDVVHSHWAYPDGTGGVLVAASLGVPSIMTLRGDEHLVDRSTGYGSCLSPHFEENFLTAVAAVKCVTVCCSDSIHRLQALGINPGKRLARLYHAVDATRLLSDQERKQDFVRSLVVDNEINILCVAGMIHERKGHVELIRAFAELKKKFRFASLILVGDGPKRQAFQELASELRVSDSVEFVGKIHPNKVSEYYRKAHLFVLPTHAEVFGNVVFEALLFNLPIVCTRRGAPGDVVSEHEFGKVVEPRDVPELAEAMSDILMDYEFWHHRAREGGRYVEERMSLKQRIDGFMACYERSVRYE